MNGKRVLQVLIALLILVSGFLVYSLFFEKEELVQEAPAPEEPAKADITHLEILCVGDVMYHSSQLTAAVQEDGTYHFEETYQYVKPYIQRADVAIFNLETTFGQAPYTGYPSFSTPDILAENLRSVGFDVAATANNHVNDRGVLGIDRTLQVLRQQHFVTTGSRDVLSRPRWATRMVKGIWVGTLAYTYQTPSLPGRVSINGSFVSQETADRINSFGYENMDAEVAKINEQVGLMKQSGMDIVILYLHWGEEYQLKANPWQHYIKESLTQNSDIDMIFGSHPHTLQEMELANQRVPVYFSLGNFVSNQRLETLGNRYTETGAMARVTLEYDRTAREITGLVMEAIPTWVEKYKKDGRDHYFIIPLDEQLEQNPQLLYSGHLARARQAKEDALGLLGTFRIQQQFRALEESREELQRNGEE
jgi:poly-gamma-glutamate synthesis protein (capsule biosynthesis protein)